MSYSTDRRPYIKTGNISEIVSNQLQRNKYTFRYVPNVGGFYLVGNKRVSVSDFNKMFPIQPKPVTKGKGLNSDKSKNWLHGEKSY